MTDYDKVMVELLERMREDPREWLPKMYCQLPPEHWRYCERLIWAQVPVGLRPPEGFSSRGLKDVFMLYPPGVVAHVVSDALAVHMALVDLP